MYKINVCTCIYPNCVCAPFEYTPLMSLSSTSIWGTFLCCLGPGREREGEREKGGREKVGRKGRGRVSVYEVIRVFAEVEP